MDLMRKKESSLTREGKKNGCIHAKKNRLASSRMHSANAELCASHDQVKKKLPLSPRCNFPISVWNRWVRRAQLNLPTYGCRSSISLIRLCCCGSFSSFPGHNAIHKNKCGWQWWSIFFLSRGRWSETEIKENLFYARDTEILSAFSFSLKSSHGWNNLPEGREKEREREKRERES